MALSQRNPASRLFLLLACCGALFSLRCGSDEIGADNPPSEAVGGGADWGRAGAGVTSACEPGETRECVGAAACRGGQQCRASGAWGACDCGGSEAGGEGGGGTGGTRAVGGGGNGAGGEDDPVACRPAPQAGCDAGEKCSIVIDNVAQTLVFACVAEGSQENGETCSARADGADDCGKGLFCNGLGTVPRCQPYCDVASATSCDTVCSELDVTTHPGVLSPSGYGVCQPTCDLLEQDCGDGNACVFVESAFPVCGEPQGVLTGEDCSFFNECEIGSACALNNAEGTSSMCTPLCEATVAGSCTAEGDTCLAFPMVYQSVPENMLTIGLCYPCSLLGVECGLLAPGGCAEEADCDPLLLSMGFDYTCDVPTGQCVMAAP